MDPHDEVFRTCCPPLLWVGIRAQRSPLSCHHLARHPPGGGKVLLHLLSGQDGPLSEFKLPPDPSSPPGGHMGTASITVMPEAAIWWRVGLFLVRLLCLS